MKIKLTLIARFVLLAASCPPISAFAQGTAFTYQGRLNDGANPATGIYDLRFGIYDLATAGTQQGNLLTNSATAVSNGLFTVTLDFGNQFPGADRWLEMGLRTNGSGDFVTLSPRQKITPTAYAIYSGSAATATTASSVANGAITAASIANGAIGSAQLAPGTAAANLAASGQAGVASGGMVLSSTDNEALLNAGYVKLGTIQVGDTWQQRVNGTPPGTRQSHTAVWTGSEMIIWGGYNGSTLNDGARYNPAANVWVAIPVSGAPAARQLHTAIWTGTEMIIWGGVSSIFLNNGGRYNPVLNTWTAVTTTGAPIARYQHSAIWTGTKMIVWGGSNGGFFNDGGRYDPASNTWTDTTTTGAPAIRTVHTAVWTGSEMIIWGGLGASSKLNDGGRYNPEANSWTLIPNSLANTPAPRHSHTAVWTGSEMIVWGGQGGSFSTTYLNDGGRYNPAGNFWTTVTTIGAPAGRYSYPAAWTGSEMIVWGGANAGGSLNDGGRYNPAGNSWTGIPNSLANTPFGRSSHTAVWTGSELIVWGGFNGTYFNDGGRYNPAGNSWTGIPTGPSSTPAARNHHTAVWTGSEMIVWGGTPDGVNAINDGSRYNPAGNTWTAVTTTGVPSARFDHTAVWTGSEMIVWGGNNGSALNDGGRYNPVGNTWTLIPNSLLNAPAARFYHTAVWTGSEMIVWGGTPGSGSFNDGGRYNPTGNSWTGIPNSLANTPSGRAIHTAIWTGSEMIIWGGFSATLAPAFYGDGGRYNPGSDSWTAVSTNGAPAPRVYHTVVWTGNEMIIWGGFNFVNSYFNDGGRYNPIGNTWTLIPNSLPNTPAARAYHTAVWTGGEMIVWGGYNASYFNDGGRYNPAGNNWTAVTTTATPAARELHTAVWTGNEMIAWGGDNGTGFFNDTWSYTPGKVMFLYQKP